MFTVVMLDNGCEFPACTRRATHEVRDANQKPWGRYCGQHAMTKQRALSKAEKGGK